LPEPSLTFTALESEVRVNIPIQVLDPDRIATVAQVFSDEIDRDPWVMFHGTSGFNADAIEREGFRPQLNAVSRAELQHVVNVYETMKWTGENLGGLAVLKPFALDHDLRDPAGRSFFAETGSRALLYATRDFAGGEKMRALRIAFADLDSYLRDADVREHHKTHMLANFRSLIRLNAHPSMIETARPVKVDLDWLREQMNTLADIRRPAHDAQRRHDHGIVYAVKLTPDDLQSLQWNSFMGIEATTTIPASKILAKISVPPDYNYDLFASRGKYLHPMNRGLLGALAPQP
jgi:hypothetical protein